MDDDTIAVLVLIGLVCTALAVWIIRMAIGAWRRHKRTYAVDVSQIELGDGDRIILTTERQLTQHQVEQLREQWEAAMADPGRKVVVLSGIKIQVLRGAAWRRYLQKRGQS